MLIRSQDRSSIINADTIDLIQADDCPTNKVFGIKAFRGESMTIVGRYSTRAKAIKVLDMIQQRKDIINLIAGAGTVANIKEFIDQNGFSPFDTFLMPQDKEVEV